MAARGLAALGMSQRPLVQLLLSQFVSGIREHVLQSASATRSRVLVLCPAAAWQHQTPPQHVEAPARISLTLQRLQMKLGELLDFEHSIIPAPEELITRVHGKQYWASLGRLRKTASAAMQSVRTVEAHAAAKHARGGASSASGRARGRGRGRGRPPKSRPPSMVPRSPLRTESADGASQSSINDAGSQRQGYGGASSAGGAFDADPRLSNGLVSVSDQESQGADGDGDSDEEGGDPWMASMAKLLERDTYVSPKTVSAVRQSVAAVLQGAKQVLAGTRIAAFALVRPPGHHAGCCSHVGRSQGFCLVNNVMCAATEVLREAPDTRVAVVDIDTHFGNGSYAIARALARSLTPSDSADGDDFTYLMRDTDAALEAMERGAVRQSHLEARAARAAGADAPHFMLASIHQFNDEAYPANVIANPDEDGRTQATQTLCEGGANVTLVTEGVPCGSSNQLWRERFRERVVAELKRFKADLVFISAGFDAHVDDPVGQLRLVDSDFQWAAQQIGGAMAAPRIVSVLEGGYGISQDSNWSLLRGAEAHVRGLTRVAETAAAARSSEEVNARAAATMAASAVPDLLQSAWDGIVQGVPRDSIAAGMPSRSALGRALLGQATADTAQLDSLKARTEKLQGELDAARAAAEQAAVAAEEARDTTVAQLERAQRQQRKTSQQLAREEERVKVLTEEMRSTTARLEQLADRAPAVAAPVAGGGDTGGRASVAYNSAMSLAERVTQQLPQAPGHSALQPLPIADRPADAEGAVGGAAPSASVAAAAPSAPWWHAKAQANRKAVHVVSALRNAKVVRALGSSEAKADGGSSSSGSSSGSGSSSSGSSSSGSGSDSGSDTDAATEADDDATVVEGDEDPSEAKRSPNASTLLAVAQSTVRTTEDAVGGGKGVKGGSSAGTTPIKPTPSKRGPGRPPGTGKKHSSPGSSPPRKLGGSKRGRVSLSQPLSQPPPATIDLSMEHFSSSSDDESSDGGSGSPLALSAPKRSRPAPRRQFARKSGSKVSSTPTGDALESSHSSLDSTSSSSTSGGSSSDSSSSGSEDESLPISQLVAKKP